MLTTSGRDDADLGFSEPQSGSKPGFAPMRRLLAGVEGELLPSPVPMGDHATGFVGDVGEAGRAELRLHHPVCVGDGTGDSSRYTLVS